MSGQKISDLADELISQFDTRDPFRIASFLDIHIKYIHTKRQKGFCALVLDEPFIFINQNMSEQMQRMTCAHELGHILLHRDLLDRDRFLLEYELFNIQNDTEYEANVFAASLLIDENELYESIQEGNDMVAIASAMNLNVNILMIRIIEMQKAGSDFHIPFTPDRKFLKTIQDKADSI